MFGHMTIDEGVDAKTCIRTVYRFEGDQVTTEKVYDAEPYIKRAQEMRERNAGKRWGEGKEVGVLPPWVLPQINAIGDEAERTKAMKLFFRQNPAFLAYDAFLK